MKITLMHPPLDDPTLPYHSTAYLTGHLAHNGFTDVSMRDVNVEFVNYCMEPQSVENYYSDADRLIRHFEKLPALSFSEQEEYYTLWATSRIEPDEISGAVAGMRDKEAFLDFPTYLKNFNTIVRYFNFLGSLCYPSEISNFRQLSRARYSIYNLTDLNNSDMIDMSCRPFARFFEERLANDPEFNDSDCLGISIVYDHQLVHSLYLARALKKRWPDKLILLGGTSISQMYKHMRDKTQMKKFFNLCDAIVVGEGETAICEIAAVEGDLSKNKFIPNLITYDREHDDLRLPQSIHYENVTGLGTPIYKHPWHLYLSPEKGINYAPTRGCYWNRCTFCDYGLNTDKPTSPWRERKIDQVVADLQRACLEEQIKYVYFAVDVMAPAYIERLSDAMLDAGLDIRWSAEMRLEKIFSAERCKKMARSGCVCISFGMESGNQRVLDLIDKGTKVQYMGETMKNFTNAGVAVQLMAFTDFPTETPEEKKETFDFIKEYDDYWSIGGMGTFLLTGTSMIAKDPAKFGIKVIETADADITRALAYRLETGSERKILLTEDCDESFNSDGGAFPPVLGRPWAGGTDTLHSMIYYDRYGNKFFRENPLDDQLVDGQVPNHGELQEVEDDKSLLACNVFAPGRINESPFNINDIFNNRNSFKNHVANLLQVPVEPCYSNFERWRSNVQPVEQAAEAHYWLTTSNRCVKIEKLVYRIIRLSAEKRLPLNSIFASLKPELQERLLAYFKELETSGLLVFNNPNRIGRVRRRNVRIDEKAICRLVKDMVPQGKLVDSATVVS
jgi:anaerobic magnesium-protoporphyrin IX monomethyl ester cyclase